MDSFEKELKDRVGEVGKEHEREARETGWHKALKRRSDAARKS